MMHGWNKLLAALLALLLLLSVGAAADDSDAVYGVCTAMEVNVRKTAGTSGALWFTIDAGHVAQILGTRIVSGEVWYKINTPHPTPNGRTYIGYVISDYFREMTEAETKDYLESQATPVPEVTPTLPPASGEMVTATGVITANGVNFRTGAGLQYGIYGKLNANTVVELLTIPAQIDANHWYRIRYNSRVGYIQAPFIRVLTVDESLLPAPEIYGYAKLLVDNVNLRESAGGNTVTQWKGKGSMLRIVGAAEAQGSYEWYPVYYDKDSTIYYVREDMITVVMLEDGVIVTPTPEPESPYGYIITTEPGVNLRLKPFGESVAQVPRGTVLACVGPTDHPAGTSYTWYMVRYKGMTGYLRGDCVRVCTSTGGSIGPTPEPTPGPTEDTNDYGYIRLVKDKVNLRTKPLGASQIQLPLNLILRQIGPVTPAGDYGKYCWYRVRTADGMTGYIRGDCAVVTDDMGVEVTPTPPPDAGEIELEGAVGRIIKNTIIFKEKSTESDVVDVVLAETIIDVLAAPADPASGWYKVRYNSQVGYVRATMLVLINDGTQVTPEPEVTPVPDDEPSAYLITTADKVNLRASYTTESDRIDQVRTGTVMPYYEDKQVGTVTWYKVVYNHQECWIHGKYIAIMTIGEYLDWLDAHPGAVPDVNDNLGYMVLTKDNVYIRNAADGTTIIDQLEKGTVLRYYSDRIQGGIYYWYLVRTPEGKFGYVRTDMVTECDAGGTPLATPTPVVGALTNSQQETDYTNLYLGSSGYRVANLVQELINQGYYKGEVTSNYTTEVYEAVKLFQAANGLSVDGKAGDATQHALFGTKPIGYGDTGNLDFAIYPVEKIDWFTGGIQEMLPRGSKFKIYDVKTGIVWWAYRQAGGKHMDIETLTAADSARLCQIYGVSNLQQIVDENKWQRRPSLVTIGSRTFACSLDGMQHGSDTISSNNMDGQVCLHFTNSQGHSSGVVSTSHAEAIEYAYNHCPSGQK